MEETVGVEDLEATTPAIASAAAVATTEAIPAKPTVQGVTIYDLMLFTMMVVWAANPAAIKWALNYMDPLVFNAIRFALATLFLVVSLAASRESLRWERGDGWKIAGLGLLGHGVYQIVFIVALNETLAGNVALILSVSPVFVAIFGAWLGYERIGAFVWVGVLCTLAGVALVVVGSGEALEFGPRLVGDLLAIVVAAMWGLYTVLSSGMLKRYSALRFNALTMSWGTLLLLLVASPGLVRTAPTLATVPAAVWVILALSALLALSASYVVWGKGIQKLGATRTAVYANLVPVMAGLIAFFVLGEPLGWQFWTGMVLVLGGVWIARFGGRVLGKFKAGWR